LKLQLAGQTRFWRSAIDVKPFAKHLARDIVFRVSKRGLEVAVEHIEVSLGRHEDSLLTCDCLSGRLLRRSAW